MEFLLATSPLWFLWPALGAILVYWYLTKNHGYWKKLGVPYIPAIPLVGSMLGSFLNVLHKTELERYQKYGRLYGHYEGSRPVLTVAHPEILRDIFVKDFPSFTSRRNFKFGNKITDNMVSSLQGEDWKRVRTIITPTFTTGKIKRMLNIFRDCAKTLSQNFLAAEKTGKPINAKSLFGAFTMDVIASSAFSTKIDSHNDPNNKFVAKARNAFTQPVPWRFMLFFLFPGLMKFFRIGVFAPKSVNFFRDVTIQIIEERKRTGQTRNDFLQLLMDTAKEVSDKERTENAKPEKEEITSNYGTEENNDIFKKYYQNKTLSHDELVANCVIFFLAGYDTTASTLSFTAYELALNPDVQEKLIKEIDELVKSEGGKLNYEAIQNMKYLDNVISETLRLYPPVIRLERLAEEDYKLGDTGLTVPKDMIVGIPAYAMHRDPEFFPEPEKYEPDRFSQEVKETRNPYTYLPFGAGPRNCVGMRFALMEIKVCLAQVLSQFRIKRCPETKVPLDFYRGQGLIQPKEILLRLESRNDAILKN